MWDSNLNEQEPEPQVDTEDTLLVQSDPIEVEAPENKDSFLRDSGFGSRKKQLPPLENKPSTEEILNTIFPPKRMEFEGHYFVRPVSIQDANREDLKNLEGKLDIKLKER